MLSTGGALGAQQERRNSGSLDEPDLAALYSATAAPLIYPMILPRLDPYVQLRRLLN